MVGVNPQSSPPEPPSEVSSWFFYDYEGTPVFFARIFYTIPYSISGTSMPLTASQSGGFIISSTVQPLNINEGPIDRTIEPTQPKPPIENASDNFTGKFNYNLTQIEKGNSLSEAKISTNENNQVISAIYKTIFSHYIYTIFAVGIILFLLLNKRREK
ncbi:hypothetical protein V7O66_04635 [Methanolobus sp. ZRKC3]|uniref:hypothetical protein n=1 Tax=Methanolobus sp. ZRKC3 TaxID=3125786 RepID=UPI003243AA53